MTSMMMTDDEFFAIAEPLGWGTATTNVDALKLRLMKQLPRERAQALCAAFSAQRARVSEAIEKAIGRAIDEEKIWVSDDGFGDLCAHIVGLGRAAIEAVVADPQLAVRRAAKRDYVESFAYVFPHESDYSLREKSYYVKLAKQTVREYRCVIEAGDDVVPFYAKLLPQLTRVHEALTSFVESGDIEALLAREQELRVTTEQIRKRLSSYTNHYAPTGSAEDCMNSITHWQVENLMGDARKYLLEQE